MGEPSVATSNSNFNSFRISDTPSPSKGKFPTARAAVTFRGTTIDYRATWTADRSASTSIRGKKPRTILLVLGKSPYCIKSLETRIILRPPIPPAQRTRMSRCPLACDLNLSIAARLRK